MVLWEYLMGWVREDSERENKNSLTVGLTNIDGSKRQNQRHLMLVLGSSLRNYREERISWWIL